MNGTNVRHDSSVATGTSRLIYGALEILDSQGFHRDTNLKGPILVYGHSVLEPGRLLNSQASEQPLERLITLQTSTLSLAMGS